MSILRAMANHDQSHSLIGSEGSHQRLPKDVGYILEQGDRLRQQLQGVAANLEIAFCHGDFHGRNACEKDAL